MPKSETHSAVWRRADFTKIRAFLEKKKSPFNQNETNNQTKKLEEVIFFMKPHRDGAQMCLSTKKTTFIRENVEADSCLIPILLNNFVSDSEEYYVEKESEDICSEV